LWFQTTKEEWKKEIKKFFGNFFGVGILIIENINFKVSIGF